MNWSEVTVSEYIEILDLQYDDLTPTELQLESIAIVTGNDYDDLDEDEVERLLNEFKWLQDAPTNEESIHRFDLLEYGSLISLMQFSSEKPPLQNIDKICALVIGYEDFKTKCQQIQDDYIVEYFAIVQTWIKYRTSILENYEDLFSADENEEVEQPDTIDIVQTRWAWMRTVWELADGDITKANDILSLPHLMVLNWITMVKDLKLNQPTQTGADND